MPEGEKQLAALKGDYRKFQILSGNYRESRRAASAGYNVSMPYRLMEYTRTGKPVWQLIKLAMRLKWFIRDNFKPSSL